MPILLQIPGNCAFLCYYSQAAKGQPQAQNVYSNVIMAPPFVPRRQQYPMSDQLLMATYYQQPNQSIGTYRNDGLYINAQLMDCRYLCSGPITPNYPYYNNSNMPPNHQQMNIQQDELWNIRNNAEEVKVEEVKVEEVKAEEVMAEEVQVEEVKAEEAQAEEVQAEEVKVEEVQAEEVMAGEDKAEEVKADVVKAEEAKAEEVKPKAQQNIWQADANEIMSFMGLKCLDKRTEPRAERHNHKKLKARETNWMTISKKHFSHPWQLNSFKGHTREVLDADFSSNGKYLATCSDDDPGSTSTEDSGGNGSSSSDSNKENTLSSSSENSISKSLSRRQKKNRTKSSFNSPRSPCQQPEKKSLDKNSSDVRQDTNNNFKQKKSRLAIYDMGLSEQHLHDLLIDFTLQPDQLFTNGYPELDEHNEVRILKRCFPVPFRIPNVRKKCDSDTDSDQNSTSSDSCEDNELGKSSISSSPVSNETVGVERTCARCNTGFFITESEYLTKERCIHHWGRLLNHHTYSCCKRSVGAAGCSSSKYHVWNGTVNGINERLEGFVQTKSDRSKKDKVYALDCEMCYTVKGLELCKVTILGFNGIVVYDHFVKPEYEVVDYNTRYSGVTESDVNSENSKTFAEVQGDLLDLISEETILLGHALDNDLRVLKLLHSRVVDTSLIFPHERGHPYKYSLKHLMSTHLNKQIQTSDSGHNSHEDALSCLELVFFKLQAHYGSAYFTLLQTRRYP